jgi:hypothetical protein
LLWISVYGDNPWPRSAQTLLPAFFLLTFVALWGTSLLAGYLTGKLLEDTPGLNRNHVLLSLGATALPVVLIALHQYGVGNIGPESASVRCSEFCSGEGYPASGMPPRDTGERTCRCLDDEGRVAITKSIADGDR